MKCSNCGNELSNNDTFCVNCGQKVPPRSKKTNRILCANCGAPLEDGMDFCGECGAHVANSNIDINYIFCGNCGKKIPANTQICPNCGQNIYTNSNKPDKKKQSGKRYAIIIIIVLIVVILALAAMIFGYFFYYNSSNNSADTENLQVTIAPAVSKKPVKTPDATPQSTDNKVEDNSAHISTNVGKLETYYVVNCNESISLRKTPSTTSEVLKDIPLGSPVSYVESSQSGFAKIIYDGIEGYALQAYLSNDPSDIKKPDYNSPADSGKSANNSSTNKTTSGSSSGSNGVVTHPSYSTYTDPDYNFSCSYPTHFHLYNEDDNFVRYSLKAADNTATLKICGTSNSANLSVQTVLDNFKSSYPGTTDYENSGNDWCACRTYKNGTYHYGYFKIKDGMIRGFEMHFDGDYYTTYDGYVNEIYDSLKFN